MKNIRLEISAMKGMEIVNELRNTGYVQGKDFDFAYYPTVQHRFNGPTKSACVIFTFYDDKLATFFILKWQ